MYRREKDIQTKKQTNTPKHGIACDKTICNSIPITKQHSPVYAIPRDYTYVGENKSNMNKNEEEEDGDDAAAAADYDDEKEETKEFHAQQKLEQLGLYRTKKRTQS